MEKIVCALWRQADDDLLSFNARILASLPDALAAAGASRVRINLRDEGVRPAAALVQQWQDPQQDAMVQYWLPAANKMFRSRADEAIGACCSRFSAWLVSEATIIPNSKHPPASGQRTWGWSQASFITFRGDVDRAASLRHWRGHHTQTAIGTQANFEYVQNLLICPLTPDAPPYDAFVEECFPPEAMSNSAAFFDAAGDKARLKANIDAMMASCTAFIDFSRIDIIPTSQFDYGERC